MPTQQLPSPMDDQTQTNSVLIVFFLCFFLLFFSGCFVSRFLLKRS
jgi:hypothetical protein